MDNLKDWEQRIADRLRTYLQREIPPRIRAYWRQGGPDPEDYERVRGYATSGVTFGDVILFPDGRGSEQSHLDKMADGVAVLAFLPGGVHLFGLDFDATNFKQEQDQDELHQLITDVDRILGLAPPRRRYGTATGEE